jgi:hypothetical protein
MKKDETWKTVKDLFEPLRCREANISGPAQIRLLPLEFLTRRNQLADRLVVTKNPNPSC